LSRAPFSLFWRSSTSSNGKPRKKLCARFFDEEGGVKKTLALESTNKRDGVLEAKGLLDKGRVATGGDRLLLDFLLDFWRVDSKYAQLKRLKGQPLSVQYVEINALLVRKHLSIPLKNVRLSELTVVKMEKVIIDMAKGGAKPRTINMVIQTVRVPITRYSREQRIPDPLEYLEKVHEKPAERGTLSPEELRALINDGQISPHVRCAILLGGLCGLRLGEVLGLQREDIDRERGRLHIRHNWQPGEGVKAPKCGSERDVPLSNIVLSAIDQCIALGPLDSPLVLCGAKNALIPIGADVIRRGFRSALNRIGVDRGKQKDRHLVFHGLRHTYVSLARVSGMNDFVVQTIAGHKNMAMTEHYSHGELVIDYSEAARSIESMVSPLIDISQEDIA
jgi:integrase